MAASGFLVPSGRPQAVQMPPVSALTAPMAPQGSKSRAKAGKRRYCIDCFMIFGRSAGNLLGAATADLAEFPGRGFFPGAARGN